MKATVNAKLLQEALEFVVAEKGDLPIINRTVALRAKGDTVVVESTDLEVIMEAIVPAVVTEEGGAVVSKSMLKHYVGAAGDAVLHCWPKGETRITNKKTNSADTGGKLHISTDESQGWIEDLGIEQYPVTLETKWKKFVTFDSEAVDHIATCVVSFAAKTSLRPVLSGMRMTERSVCCTDSYRLCEYLHDGKAKEEIECIVPVKPFPLIHKHAKSVVASLDKERRFIRYDLGDLRVTNSPIRKIIKTRTIEGKYPPYKQVLLKKNEIKAVMVMEREPVLAAIKRLHPVAKEVNNNVTYVAKKGDSKLFMSSRHHAASMEVHVNLADLAPTDIRIALSSEYVTDVMRSMYTKNVLFEYQDSMHPAQFRMEDDRKTVVIVMPLRLQED